jgi:hypothetical protein
LAPAPTSLTEEARYSPSRLSVTAKVTKGGRRKKEAISSQRDRPWRLAASGLHIGRCRRIIGCEFLRQGKHLSHPFLSSPCGLDIECSIFRVPPGDRSLESALEKSLSHVERNIIVPKLVAAQQVAPVAPPMGSQRRGALQPCAPGRHRGKATVLATASARLELQNYEPRRRWRRWWHSRQSCCWCKFGTEGGHQHHSNLLLRRGKESKGPFGGRHLLPLLLTLLLLQLLSKN